MSVCFMFHISWLMKEGCSMLADDDPVKVCWGASVIHTGCFGCPFLFTPAAEWREPLALAFLKQIATNYSYEAHHPVALSCAHSLDAFLAAHASPCIFGLLAFGDASLTRSVYQHIALFIIHHSLITGSGLTLQSPSLKSIFAQPKCRRNHCLA